MHAEMLPRGTEMQVGRGGICVPSAEGLRADCGAPAGSCGALAPSLEGWRSLRSVSVRRNLLSLGRV